MLPPPLTTPYVKEEPEDDIGAGSAAEIEHGFARFEVFTRVAAAVVALDHLRRDDLEISGVIVDRTAKLRFLGVGGGAVSFFDGTFGVGFGQHNRCLLPVLHRMS